MPDSLISALIQAPFVLVMAYLVHRFLTHLNARDMEWRAFTDEMHASLGERLKELTEAIDKLTEIVIAHDAVTRGIMQMQERRASGDGEPVVLRRVR